MRNLKALLQCVVMFITTIVYAQNEFTITEKGITPELLTMEISHSSKNELRQQTRDWMEANKEAYKLSINHEDNTRIELTSIIGNAVHIKERYYHAKYTVAIAFSDMLYTFEPTQIHLKLNSKYDMGWKELNVNDQPYFKKGKVTRKYRDYFSTMTTLLNQMNSELNTYLMSGPKSK